MASILTPVSGNPGPQDLGLCTRCRFVHINYTSACYYRTGPGLRSEREVDLEVPYRAAANGNRAKGEKTNRSAYLELFLIAFLTGGESWQLIGPGRHYVQRQSISGMCPCL